MSGNLDPSILTLDSGSIFDFVNWLAKKPCHCMIHKDTAHHCCSHYGFPSRKRTEEKLCNLGTMIHSIWYCTCSSVGEEVAERFAGFQGWTGSEIRTT